MIQQIPRFKVKAIREKQPFVNSVPGIWLIEVEGWNGPPPVGGFLQAVPPRCPTCGCPDPKHMNHGRTPSQGPCPDPFHAGESEGGET